MLLLNLRRHAMPRLTRREVLSAAAVSAASLGAADAFAQERRPEVPAIPFKLGIVTYNIAAEWDVPTILRICRAVGLGPVELRTTHKHGVEPSMSNAARKEVRQQFADAGVEIWGLGSVCEFHSPDPAVVRRQIDTCKEFIQLAADIGGKGVKVRPNALPANVPTEKTLDQIGKALTECGRAAADAGVEVWVEVHGPGTAHPPHMRMIMQAADHRNVGVTWNSNNTDVVNGSVAESFRLLRPWIKSCHINELTSGYPYRELFRLLREANYDRVTLAEIQGMPTPATAERFMRYYKALWTELAKG
jgi:sugar phosphate isomerase/epimerase